MKMQVCYLGETVTEIAIGIGIATTTVTKSGSETENGTETETAIVGIVRGTARPRPEGLRFVHVASFYKHYLVSFFLTFPDYQVGPVILITGSPKKGEIERSVMLVWFKCCKND